MDNSTEKQLQDIREKLEAIESKTASKQWFAIALVIVTAFVSGLGYVLEKQMDQLSARTISYERVLGEQAAHANREFFEKSQEMLGAFQNSLTEYCEFGNDQKTTASLIDIAAQLTSLIDKSSVDKPVRDALEDAIDIAITEVHNIKRGGPGTVRTKDACDRATRYIDRGSELLDKLLSE